MILNGIEKDVLLSLRSLITMSIGIGMSPILLKVIKAPLLIGSTLNTS